MGIFSANDRYGAKDGCAQRLSQLPRRTAMRRGCFLFSVERAFSVTRMSARDFLGRLVRQLFWQHKIEHNRDEEKEHAAMVLEWIRRRDRSFDKELKDYLFTDSKIAHQ